MYLSGDRCVPPTLSRPLSRAHISQPRLAGIDESEGGEFMAECEICHAWQHGTCMGYQSPEAMPLHYYCEKCKPELYVELLKCAPHLPRCCSPLHVCVLQKTRQTRSPVLGHLPSHRQRTLLAIALAHAFP